MDQPGSKYISNRSGNNSSNLLTSRSYPHFTGSPLHDRSYAAVALPYPHHHQPDEFIGAGSQHPISIHPFLRSPRLPKEHPDLRRVESQRYGISLDYGEERFPTACWNRFNIECQGFLLRLKVWIYHSWIFGWRTHIHTPGISAYSYHCTAIHVIWSG